MTKPPARARRFKFSNFQPCEITFMGITFPSVEHYYQSMKTRDPDQRRLIARAPSPGAAKRLGRLLALRSNWLLIKDDVMLYGLRQKFKPGSDYARELLAASDDELVEWNHWHDIYWGRCYCEVCGGSGINRLGELLTQVRSELREKEKAQ